MARTGTQRHNGAARFRFGDFGLDLLQQCPHRCSLESADASDRVDGNQQSRYHPFWPGMGEMARMIEYKEKSAKLVGRIPCLAAEGRIYLFGWSRHGNT